MRWEIRGADRETGADATIVVDAEGEDSARRRANRRGIVVSGVRPLDPNDSCARLPTLVIEYEAPTSGTSMISSLRSPPASSSQPPEQTLLTLKPKMLTGNPALFVFAVILVPLLGLGILILACWYLSCITQTLTVTSKRSILRRGVLSKSTTEVRHEDVRNTQVSQTLLQRLFGTGQLAISTAARNEVEIRIADIPNPEKARRLINELRDQLPV